MVTIQTLLHELSQGQAHAVDHACVFCREATESTLTLCGHPYCSDCLKSFYVDEPETTISCRQCQQPVLPEDLSKHCPAGSDWDSIVRAAIKTLVKQRSSLMTELALCPSTSCGGVISAASGVRPCLLCNTNICTRCEVADNSVHAGKSCTAFRKALKDQETMGGLSVKLVEAARAFATREWPADMGAICSIDVNPAMEISRQAPSLLRFLAALGEQANSLNVDQAGLFAWHGTAADAVAPICHTGFDPNRRSGQAYGVGEYFGQSANVSHGYCRGSSHMIVAYLLRGSHFSQHGNFCYVVNNPKTWNLSFCVPVAVVTFGEGTPPIFQTPPPPATAAGKHLQDEEAVLTSASTPLVQNQAPPSGLAEAQFRWHWQQDGGSMEPYTDDVNTLLEGLYDAHMHDGGPRSVVTSIRRYLDDRPQAYRIEFGNGRQVNLATTYSRAIERRAVDIPHTGREAWCFFNAQGVWQRFEAVVQAVIARSFSACAGRGPSRNMVTFPGRPETYEINFAASTQRNTVTDTVRTIGLRM